MGGITAGGVAAGVGAAASAGSAISSLTSGSPSPSDAQAEGYQQQAYQLWNQLGLPTLNNTPLQQVQNAGNLQYENYTPYTGQVYQMTPDTTAANQEQTAYNQLQQFTQNGLNTAELASLMPIQQAQAASAQSNYNTGLAQLGAQGDAGAGAAYATQLAASQNAANSSQSLYNTALQNALTNQTTAIQNSGADASAMRTQSDTESQDMANINNQFNTELQNLRTGAAQTAANNYNTAQQYDLTNQQNLNATNTGIANTSQETQNQNAQQQFQNQESKISGQANALNTQANTSLATQAAAAQQSYGQSAATSAALANAGKTLTGNAGTIGTALGGSGTTSTNTANTTNTSSDGWDSDPGSSTGTSSWGYLLGGKVGAKHPAERVKFNPDVMPNDLINNQVDWSTLSKLLGGR